MSNETAIETAVIQEFKIPDANLHNLQERIEKLSKKAMKLMGQPITLTVIKTFDVERTKHNFATGKQEGTGVFDRFHIVTVSGPRPKLSGWVFSAALDVVDVDGERAVMVRNAPGETIPTHLREHVEGCDHCHTNRRRKTLFVLRKEA
jgi:hypothetical protein